VLVGVPLVKAVPNQSMPPTLRVITGIVNIGKAGLELPLLPVPVPPNVAGVPLTEENMPLSKDPSKPIQ
jgi:hypothetical protein